MEEEYRNILGWNPDGSGLLHRKCKVCGAWVRMDCLPVPYSKMCRDCHNAYQRTVRALNASKKEIQKEDIPTCRHCKHYSTQAGNAKMVDRGWCMKRRMSVYGSSGCALHQYPRRGKYEQEARQV